MLKPADGRTFLPATASSDVLLITARFQQVSEGRVLRKDFRFFLFSSADWESGLEKKLKKQLVLAKGKKGSSSTQVRQAGRESESTANPAYTTFLYTRRPRHTREEDQQQQRQQDIMMLQGGESGSQVKSFN